MHPAEHLALLIAATGRNKALKMLQPTRILNTARGARNRRGAAPSAAPAREIDLRCQTVGLVAGTGLQHNLQAEEGKLFLGTCNQLRLLFSAQGLLHSG